MDTLLSIRIAAVVLIALVYMLFDVFNRRNVPSAFAYGTVIVGALFTIAYLNTGAIVESFLIAAIITAIGYVLYRVGQIGAADVLELASISMILPVLSTPYAINYPQFGVPFIVAVFIASGIFALVMIPFYYIPRASRIMHGRFIKAVKSKDMLKGLLVLVAYGAFIAFLVSIVNLSAIWLVMLVVLGICSVQTTIFEKPLTDSMVEFIPASQFEEGDIVALNIMDRNEIGDVRRRVKDFDRLMTTKLIGKMRRAWPKRRFPVYRSAIPLALPIFVGTMVSLLFGNVVLLVLADISFALL